MTRPLDHVLGLRCVLCGAEYEQGEVEYVCPKHGDEGILDVLYDYDRIRPQMEPATLAKNPDRSLWRYSPLLPVHPKSPRPPLTVGWTPLISAPRLAGALGVSDMLIKDDGRNPTASFKDRASAVAVVRAMEEDRRVICAASTGNAASSLSGLCASVGWRNIIFVPETAPRAKIAQLQVFGAKVLAVKGTYDQAFDLCLEVSRAYGWYSRNTAYNPYLSEGKKTASFEIWEQMGYTMPDAIAVSVGDGCIIGGLAKGLMDLKKLGLIDKLPKLIGVQAEGSSVLAKAYGANTETITVEEPTTLADSISVGQPRDAIKALRGVRATDGLYVTVRDDEILAAMRDTARLAGVFGEPAGVTPVAGLTKLAREGKLDPNGRYVAIVSGNGLKDVESAIKAGGEPMRIEPRLSEVEALKAKLVG